MTQSSEIAKRVDEEFGEHFRATDPSEAGPDNGFDLVDSNAVQPRQGHSRKKLPVAGRAQSESSHDLPAAPDLELALVAGLVKRDGLAAKLPRDTPKLFNDPALGRLADNIFGLADIGRPVDLDLLKAQVIARGEDWGESLPALTDAVARSNYPETTAAALEYVETLRTLWRKRRAALIGWEIYRGGCNGLGAADLAALFREGEAATAETGELATRPRSGGPGREMRSSPTRTGFRPSRRQSSSTSGNSTSGTSTMRPPASDGASPPALPKLWD
jgi:hypothetical protein